MQHILIVDDDIHIGNVLEELLSKEGYGVVRAYSGTEALYALEAKQPDLVLLDLMLPGLSGEDVLARIQGIPVIVLSAKLDIDSKVSLLLGGAVDYVTKPFDTRELLARIAVHLKKRASDAQNTVLTLGGLSLNPDAHRVRIGDREAKLTRTETAILKVLLQHPAQVVTKTLLLERISLDTPDCTESSLKMHVSNLRRKLREAGAAESIEAVWGIGFRLSREGE